MELSSFRLFLGAVHLKVPEWPICEPLRVLDGDLNELEFKISILQVYKGCVCVCVYLLQGSAAGYR